MFEDRKKGFEKKLELDAQKKFKVAVIRNKALGRWAALKLGLDNSKIEDYINQVVAADFDEPVHEDVIKKLHIDFEKANMNISYEEIEKELNRLEKEAVSKLSI